MDGGRAPEDGSRAADYGADVSVDAKSLHERMDQLLPPMLFPAPLLLVGLL